MGQLSKTVLVLFPPLVSHSDCLLEHRDDLLICQHGTHQPAKRTHHCKAKGSDGFSQYSNILKSCYFHGRILCPIMTISVSRSPPLDDGFCTPNGLSYYQHRQLQRHQCFDPPLPLLAVFPVLHHRPSSTSSYSAVNASAIVISGRHARS